MLKLKEPKKYFHRNPAVFSDKLIKKYFVSAEFYSEDTEFVFLEGFAGENENSVSGIIEVLNALLDVLGKIGRGGSDTAVSLIYNLRLFLNGSFARNLFGNRYNEFHEACGILIRSFENGRITQKDADHVKEFIEKMRDRGRNSPKSDRQAENSDFTVSNNITVNKSRNYGRKVEQRHSFSAPVFSSYRHFGTVYKNSYSYPVRNYPDFSEKSMKYLSEKRRLYSEREGLREFFKALKKEEKNAVYDFIKENNLFSEERKLSAAVNRTEEQYLELIPRYALHKSIEKFQKAVDDENRRIEERRRQNSAFVFDSERQVKKFFSLASYEEISEFINTLYEKGIISENELAGLQIYLDVWKDELSDKRRLSEQMIRSFDTVISDISGYLGGLSREGAEAYLTELRQNDILAASFGKYISRYCSENSDEINVGKILRYEDENLGEFFDSFIGSGGLLPQNKSGTGEKIRGFLRESAEYFSLNNPGALCNIYGIMQEKYMPYLFETNTILENIKSENYSNIFDGYFEKIILLSRKVANAYESRIEQHEYQIGENNAVSAYTFENSEFAELLETEVGAEFKEFNELSKNVKKVFGGSDFKALSLYWLSHESAVRSYVYRLADYYGGKEGSDGKAESNADAENLYGELKGLIEAQKLKICEYQKELFRTAVYGEKYEALLQQFENLMNYVKRVNAQNTFNVHYGSNKNSLAQILNSLPADVRKNAEKFLELLTAKVWIDSSANSAQLLEHIAEFESAHGIVNISSALTGGRFIEAVMKIRNKELIRSFNYWDISNISDSVISYASQNYTLENQGGHFDIYRLAQELEKVFYSNTPFSDVAEMRKNQSESASKFLTDYIDNGRNTDILERCIETAGIKLYGKGKVLADYASKLKITDTAVLSKFFDFNGSRIYNLENTAADYRKFSEEHRDLYDYLSFDNKGNVSFEYASFADFYSGSRQNKYNVFNENLSDISESSVNRVLGKYVKKYVNEESIRNFNEKMSENSSQILTNIIMKYFRSDKKNFTDYVCSHKEYKLLLSAESGSVSDTERLRLIRLINAVSAELSEKKERAGGTGGGSVERRLLRSIYDLAVRNKQISFSSGRVNGEKYQSIQSTDENLLPVQLTDRKLQPAQSAEKRLRPVQSAGNNPITRYLFGLLTEKSNYTVFYNMETLKNNILIGTDNGESASPGKAEKAFGIEGTVLSPAIFNNIFVEKASSRRNLKLNAGNRTQTASEKHNILSYHAKYSDGNPALYDNTDSYGDAQMSFADYSFKENGSVSFSDFSFAYQSTQAEQHGNFEKETEKLSKSVERLNKELNSVKVNHEKIAGEVLKKSDAVILERNITQNINNEILMAGKRNGVY